MVAAAAEVIVTDLSLLLAESDAPDELLDPYRAAGVTVLRA